MNEQGPLARKLHLVAIGFLGDLSLILISWLRVPDNEIGQHICQEKGSPHK